MHRSPNAVGAYVGSSRMRESQGLDLTGDCARTGSKARTAALTLSGATRAAKDAALHAMADSLAKSETAILEANT